MLGLPDERDVEEWRASDPTTPREDLDRAPGARPGEGRAPSDAELIEAVRGGAVRSYGQLYARHVTAARRLARQLSRSPVEADDLVSDAFAKVLLALRGGRGPAEAFRPYLLTTLRHTAYDRTRHERRVELAGDLEAVSGVERVVSQPFHDTAVARLERSLAARAFASLPERWRVVLWHTEVEGQSHAEVAPLLGLTTNGVSAIAYRAREGLRKAYVQAHVEQNPGGRCRAAASRLGAWTRRGLSTRETAQVESHLDECVACRALAAELTDVSGALRAVVAPLVLGIGASGYLAAAGGEHAAGAAAAVGGASGGGTSGTGTGAGTGAAGGGSEMAGSGSGAAGGGATTPTQWLGAAASAVAVLVAVLTGADVTRQAIVPDLDPTSAPGEVGVSPTSSAEQPPAPGATTAPTTTTGAAAPRTTGSTTIAPSTTIATTTTANAVTPPGSELTPDVPTAFATGIGGPPTDLPVTVHNTGVHPLPPPVLTLSLPDDLRVVGQGNNLLGRRLVAFDGATGRPRAGCPAGRGAVTCVAGRELAPGESVTFVVRLLAGPRAVSGTITGTVSAGSLPATPVVVPVTITSG
ncbi:sigma-70 family RNA polymerase sigma factor [Saccharothrix xinjiangensis]|uniref:Sigma-70 family RNA polymerase sigma factor n=1 Tax=Saccharothrix xinjiangensis TaxID=204798 RepID=A0ABV9XTG5_9PSEU